MTLAERVARILEPESWWNYENYEKNEKFIEPSLKKAHKVIQEIEKCWEIFKSGGDIELRNL